MEQTDGIKSLQTLKVWNVHYLGVVCIFNESIIAIPKMFESVTQRLILRYPCQIYYLIMNNMIEYLSMSMANL